MSEIKIITNGRPPINIEHDGETSVINANKAGEIINIEGGEIIHGDGSSLPIEISDVNGLQTELNSKAEQSDFEAALPLIYAGL